jgi:hypothetical protein
MGVNTLAGSRRHGAGGLSFPFVMITTTINEEWITISQCLMRSEFNKYMHVCNRKTYAEKGY